MSINPGCRPRKYAKNVDNHNRFYYINSTKMKKVLSGIWAAWKRAAHVVGRFQTRVIITLFYCLILSPVGLLMRLCGWDPLESRKSKAARGTNWKAVKDGEPDHESLRRQS